MGMALLTPTPADELVDAEGRPYFLWDMEMSLDRFRAILAGGDRALRAYLAAKLMRQARPDDVFTFLGIQEIRELWPAIEPHLGQTRSFWTWILDAWEAIDDDG